MDDVAHYMEGGILPGNQVAVVPDFGGRLNRHEGLKGSFDRAGDGYISAYRESRQRVTACFELAPRRKSFVSVGGFGFYGVTQLFSVACGKKGGGVG